MKARIINDSGDLNQISHAWANMRLSADVPPTHDYIWYLSCAETLIEPSSLFVVIVEDNSDLCAIAPLVHISGFPGGYELIGDSTLGEPSDLVYTSESSLAYLLTSLAELKKPLTLRRISPDSMSVAAIQKAYKGKAIVIKSRYGGYPYIPLVSNDSDPEEQLSSRLRSDLRRALRKADALGEVSYEIIQPGSEREFLQLYDQAMRVEVSGWKGRSGSALASDVAYQEFFRRYGIRALDKGILRFAFMRIDSAVVAMQYAVQTDSAFWLLKIGYDEEYGKCSPGMLLMLNTLRYAANQRLLSYELLRYSAPWTQRWTSHYRKTVRIDTYPYNPSGVAALSKRVVGHVWVRVLKKIKKSK